MIFKIKCNIFNRMNGYDFNTYCIKIRIRDIVNCINNNNYIKIYYSLKHGYKCNYNNNIYSSDQLNEFNDILNKIQMENIYIKYSSYELFDYLNNNLVVDDYLIIPVISENTNYSDICNKIKRYAKEINIENFNIISIMTYKKYIYS